MSSSHKQLLYYYCASLRLRSHVRRDLSHFHEKYFTFGERLIENAGQGENDWISVLCVTFKQADQISPQSLQLITLQCFLVFIKLLLLQHARTAVIYRLTVASCFVVTCG